MNIFVICQSYPSENNQYAMNFVHPRVKGYQSLTPNLYVISFSADKSYTYDNVKVLTSSEGEYMISKLDKIMVVSHAPNLKKHILFIMKYRKKIYHLILFFHGHEILKTKDYYPKPYDFNVLEKNNYKKLCLYDYIKLPIMSIFLRYISKKVRCDIVFVSNWMLEAAEKSINCDLKKIFKQHIHIINNTINQHIKIGAHSLSLVDKKADFVTIRPLDQSKYAIDLVIRFAKANKNYSFHIYGKGNFFKFNDLPRNVTVFDTFIKHEDISNLLDKYSYAIMPTRLDAQGVMMCEMASYGMPIIVSDIPVCHEMLDEFKNIFYCKNSNFDISFDDINIDSFKYIDKFSQENTIEKEIMLLKKALK